MIMSYREWREAVPEDFVEFHVKLKYSVEQSFYATLGESVHSKYYTQTDECCICVLFARILKEHHLDADFLSPFLSELLLPNHMNLYRNDLGDEFGDFESDVAEIKSLWDFLDKFDLNLNKKAGSEKKTDGRL